MDEQQEEVLAEQDQDASSEDREYFEEILKDPNFQEFIKKIEECY